MNQRDLKLIKDMIRNSGASRAVLTGVNDKSKMQEVQARGLDGEVFERAERMQIYGVSSNPPLGSEAVAIPVGADRSHVLIMGASDRGVRKNGLAPGEVALYNGNGDFIALKEGNKMEASTKDFKMDAQDAAEIKSTAINMKGDFAVSGKDGGPGKASFEGDMTINGDLVINGNLTVTGDVVISGISFLGHTHPGCQGGSTGPPQ
jgi:phage baseplate assembly protein V